VPRLISIAVRGGRGCSFPNIKCLEIGQKYSRKAKNYTNKSIFLALEASCKALQLAVRVGRQMYVGWKS